MRYGICTNIDNIELLENAGYDYIEMSVSSIMSLTMDEFEGLVDRINASKIRCEACNILFPKTMRLIGPEVNQDELHQYLVEVMNRISKIGCKVVVFGSGKCRMIPKGYDFKKAYTELICVFRLTGEIAKAYGITVVIEPLSRIETNFINTMQEGALLEAAINHPNVKLLSDYYHVISNHDSILDMEFIGSFAHIHIAAGNGRLYPVSEENEQYAEYIKVLKKIGYEGRISIEGKTENIKEDAVKALTLLKRMEMEAYEES